VLCNACGTWLKKNNTMRPLERIQVSIAMNESQRQRPLRGLFASQQTSTYAFAGRSCRCAYSPRLYSPPSSHPMHSALIPPTGSSPQHVHSNSAPLPALQLSMQPKRKKEAAAPIRPPKAAKKPRTAVASSHRLSRQASAAASAATAALVSVPSDADAMYAPEQQQQQELSSSSCSADLTHAPGMLLSDSSGSLDTSQGMPPAAAMAAAAAAAAAGFCPPMPYGFAAGYLGHPLPIPGMFM
jgi:hypothetical protein